MNFSHLFSQPDLKTIVIEKRAETKISIGIKQRTCALAKTCKSNKKQTLIHMQKKKK